MKKTYWQLASTKECRPIGKCIYTYAFLKYRYWRDFMFRFFRANQVQSPLTTIPTPPQSKLPLGNYKYQPNGSLSSGIPLPRHSSPRSTLIQESSRHCLMQQESDVRSFSKEDNVTILSRAGTNLDHSFERHSKKGDYSSDESSNLSGEFI